MPHVETLRAAANDICAAALLGSGWIASLEGFAMAAGAQGAVLMANRGTRTLSEIHTPEIDEPVAAFIAGRRPASSRQVRVPTGVGAGFRIDQDDYAADELARDPYYQEFLRPFGFFWHANAAVAGVRGHTVELSLKRHHAAGPFERSGLPALDAVLPELRTAAMLALLSFEAEMRGIAGVLARGAEAVFDLDARGTVIADHGADVRGLPVDVVSGRLRGRDPEVQRAVDGALVSALAKPGRPAARMLRSGGRDYLLQALPVPGPARDVFLAATALVVVADLSQPRRPDELRLMVLAETFRLTRREATVAAMLCDGASVADIAERLGLRRETARTHLKHVFDKTGAKRQAELVAIASRLVF